MLNNNEKLIAVSLQIAKTAAHMMKIAALQPNRVLLLHRKTALLDVSLGKREVSYSGRVSSMNRTLLEVAL